LQALFANFSSWSDLTAQRGQELNLLNALAMVSCSGFDIFNAEA